MTRYCNGDTAEYKGHCFTVTIEQDTDMGEPWKEHDGHGEVSEWTSRDKRPGEWELCSDRSSKRFYDAQASNELAKKEGWGLGDEDKAQLLERLCRPVVKWIDLPGGRRERVEIEMRTSLKPLTKGEIRAEAVRRDYEYLRGWCNDEWTWMWVRVEMVDEDGVELGYDDSLGGIEGSDMEYVDTCVEECMDNAIHEFDKALRARIDAEIEDTIDMAIEDHEATFWRARGVLTVPYTITMGS